MSNKNRSLGLRFFYWVNLLAPTGPPALGTAPAGLAGAVFQHYAHLGEAVAGGVGGGPVLVGAGLVALGDQLLDLGHFVVRFATLEEGVRVLLQYAEHGAEFPQALLDKPVPADSLRPVFWKTAGNIPFRGLATLATTGIRDAPPAIIAVATDISHHEHFMSSFRITLWSFVVLAALLTGFLGWVAVRRGLYPLQAMRSKAEGITAQKLDDRLDVESVPLELMDLAETLNAMLSRLEDSFRRLSDFSSDLAHELRTPVSNLLTQTQVTLSRPRTPDDYRDVLVSNVEEFERLSRMIADMLFIAKADEGRIVPSREKIELERVAEDMIDFYRLIADEKGVSLSRSGAAQVIGDPLMMRRAIGNLLSNAIRHSPSGEVVRIAIEPGDTGRIRIIVTNSGETIPPAHLPRLFDRFYRVDPSRHWQGTHSGLGLAIVKSIVEAHGGEVSVVSAAGKTSFAMVIPRGD